MLWLLTRFTALRYILNNYTISYRSACSVSVSRISHIPRTTDQLISLQIKHWWQIWNVLDRLERLTNTSRSTASLTRPTSILSTPWRWVNYWRQRGWEDSYCYHVWEEAGGDATEPCGWVPGDEGATQWQGGELVAETQWC